LRSSQTELRDSVERGADTSRAPVDFYGITPVGDSRTREYNFKEVGNLEWTDRGNEHAGLLYFV
jgi:hypothetical protein